MPRVPQKEFLKGSRSSWAMATCIHIERQLASELLSSAGRVRSFARGSSMLPTIFPGDTLEIRSAAFDDVRVGDIVLALNGDHLCTHRVVREEVRTERRVLITSGDALPFEDPRPVSENEFLGCVDHIVRGGERFKPETARSAWHALIAGALQHLNSTFARFPQLSWSSRRQASGPSAALSSSRGWGKS
jgi:hypothetical protein